MIRVVLTTMLMLSVVAPTAGQQAAPPAAALIPAKSTVRIYRAGASEAEFAGRVVIHGDSLVPQRSGEPAAPVHLAGIDSIQIRKSTNRPGAAFTGFWGGALVGAVALGTVGYLYDRFGETNGEGIPGAPLGAAVGALIGAPLGAAVMGTRGFRSWVTIWPPSVGGDRLEHPMRGTARRMAKKAEVVPEQHVPE